MFIVQLFLAIIFDNFVRMDSEIADAESDGDKTDEELDELLSFRRNRSDEVRYVSHGADGEAANGGRQRLPSPQNAPTKKGGKRSKLSQLNDKALRRVTKMKQHPKDRLRAAVIRVITQNRFSKNAEPSAWVMFLQNIRSAVEEEESWFNRAALAVIVANAGTMCSMSFSDSPSKTATLEW